MVTNAIIYQFHYNLILSFITNWFWILLQFNIWLYYKLVLSFITNRFLVLLQINSQVCFTIRFSFSLQIDFSRITIWFSVSIQTGSYKYKLLQITTNDYKFLGTRLVSCIRFLNTITRNIHSHVGWALFHLGRRTCSFWLRLLGSPHGWGRMSRSCRSCHSHHAISGSWGTWSHPRMRSLHIPKLLIYTHCKR